MCVAALAGIIAGVLLLDKASENRQLRAQLHELMACRPRVRAYVQEGNGESQVREVWPQAPSDRRAARGPFEITDEDRSLSQEMSARRSKGEYLNMFDDPVAYKRWRQGVARAVRMLATRNRTNLGPVFARLGLSDQAADQLLAHVSKINDAAMQAEGMVLQLQTAREDYDTKVRSLMSRASYGPYRQFEAAGPARGQFEKLERFARQAGKTITERERESFVAIIQEAEAYPKESYLGPYDGLPVTAVGKENVLRNAKRQLAEVSEGATRALRLASERGLPKQAIDLLRDYYAHDSRKRSDQIRWIQDPKTEERMRAEARKRAERIKHLRRAFPARRE